MNIKKIALPILMLLGSVVTYAHGVDGATESFFSGK